MAKLRCPKCCHELPDWHDEVDSSLDLARACFIDRTCIYEICDDMNCRALINPSNVAEFKESLKHWKQHHSYHGCSHGR